MKIVHIASKQTYRFNCPSCASRLEAESQELKDIGGRVRVFHCPICRKDRYISETELRKKYVYEDAADTQ